MRFFFHFNGRFSIRNVLTVDKSIEPAPKAIIELLAKMMRIHPLKMSAKSLKILVFCG